MSKNFHKQGNDYMRVPYDHYKINYRHMKYKYVLTSILLFIACACNKSNQQLEFTSTDWIIQETEQNSISGLPVEFFISDTSFFFINRNVINKYYFTNDTLLLSRIIDVELKYSEIIKDSNKLKNLQLYDLSKHPKQFIRNYPRHELLAINIVNSRMYLFYYKLFPVIHQGTLKLNLVPLLVQTDFNGKQTNCRIIESDYFEDYQLAMDAIQGFLLKDNILISNGFYLKDKVNSSSSVIELKGSDSLLYNSHFDFPFPTELYTFIEENKGEYNRIYCGLREFEGKVFHSNSLEIFDVYNSELFFSLKGKMKDDLRLKIGSFDFIKYEGRNLLAMIVELVAKPSLFGGTRKILQVVDVNKNHVLYEEEIGIEVSGLKAYNNDLYFMKSENNVTKLIKYEIKN